MVATTVPQLTVSRHDQFNLANARFILVFHSGLPARKTVWVHLSAVLYPSIVILIYMLSLRDLRGTYICLSIQPSIHPSIYPSIHPSIHPSIYRYVYILLRGLFCLFFPAAWVPRHLVEGVNTSSRRNLPSFSWNSYSFKCASKNKIIIYSAAPWLVFTFLWLALKRGLRKKQ